VADPEFYNGGRTVEVKGLCTLPEKIEFLSETGGFWCIQGLLFTFMQKLVRSMGAAPPPPESATGPDNNSRDEMRSQTFVQWITFI